MTAYRYRATSEAGRIRTGTMEAEGERALSAMLKTQGLELISVHTAVSNANAPASRRPSFGDSLWTARRGASNKKLNDDTRALLCRQTHDLLTAGLAFDEALAALAQTTPTPALRDRLLETLKRLQGGADAASAFGPDFFDPATQAILRSGLAHGDLAAAFAQMEEHLRRRAALKRKLRRAVRYPLFLLAIALSVTAFMMIVVVPSLTAFLSGLGQALPASSRLLIACAELFSILWWALPAALIAAFALLAFLRRHVPRVRLATDALVLRLPIVGPLALSAGLARMSAGLSLLLSASLTLPDALKNAAALCGNAALTREIEAARGRLLEGTPLSAALGRTVSPLIVQRLAIAEKSGTLPQAMAALAQSLERETSDAVESFLGLLEPALTLLVGALLAWIVLAVLGPVYGSLGPLTAGA